MKRFVLWLLIAALTVCFSGCAGWNANEYVSVVDHDAPYAYHPEATEAAEETNPPIPTASNYYQMRTILRGFVISGVEHGQLILTDYEGELEGDLKKVTRYLTAEDPISAYATDYLACERKSYGSGWLITVNAVYRRSVSEIQAIQPVRGTDTAYKKMLDALIQQNGSVTLQVSGYINTDFNQKLYQYCLENPDEIPVPPMISVASYPDSGNVRVLEVHFVYEYDRETLRNMRTEADAMLNSAYNYIRYAKSDPEKIELLYTFLTSRFPCQKKAKAGAYDLLCKGECDPMSFSSVVNYLCNKADLESYIVTGTKDGAEHCWNIIGADGVYRHFDFFTAAMEEQPAEGKTDDEMTEYKWSRASFPACTETSPEPSEPAPGETNVQTP